MELNVSYESTSSTTKRASTVSLEDAQKNNLAGKIFLTVI